MDFRYPSAYNAIDYTRRTAVSNDSCPTAFSITPGSPVTPTLVDNTEKWYKYVAPSDGYVTVEIDPAGSEEGGIYVSIGTDCDNMDTVATLIDDNWQNGPTATHFIAEGQVLYVIPYASSNLNQGGSFVVTFRVPSQYRVTTIGNDGAGAALFTVETTITEDIDGHILWITGTNYQGMWGPITKVSDTTFSIGAGTYDGDVAVSDDIWVNAGVAAGWYEADGQEYDDGDTPTAWTDRSGNGKDLARSGDGVTFLTSVIGSYPAMEFNGSSEAFVNADVPLDDSHNYTLIALFRAAPTQTTTTKVAVSYGSGGGGVPTAWLGYNTFSGDAQLVGSPSTEDIYSPDVTRTNDTNWHLLTVIRENGSFAAYDGDALLGSEGISDDDTGTKFVIGDYASGGFNWPGMVAAAVLLDSGVDPAPWQEYLTWKYGLPQYRVPAPLNLAVSEVGDGTVTLTWDAVSFNGVPVGSYNVYIRTDPGNPWSLLAEGVIDTTYTATGLTNDTLYYFTVTAESNAVSVSNPMKYMNLGTRSINDFAGGM